MQHFPLKSREDSAGEPDASQSGGTVIITDHAGSQVEIPREVNRVVVTDILPLPSIITVFLGSGEKIVGMAPASMSAARTGLLGELFPDILNASTDFMNGSDINMEELMKLEPDVVFYNAGSKENAVGFLRRNRMVPPMRAESYGQLSRFMLERCDGLAASSYCPRLPGVPVAEVFDEERAALMPLPSTAFDPVRWESRTADKYGLVLSRMARRLSASRPK